MFSLNPKMLVTTSHWNILAADVELPCTAWPNDLLTANKHVGNSKPGVMIQNVTRSCLTRKREEGGRRGRSVCVWGGVIMVTLSPIAKGIQSLVWLQSDCETRHIKRIITQTSQWSPITPWHPPLRRFVSHRPDYCVYVRFFSLIYAYAGSHDSSCYAAVRATSWMRICVRTPLK